MEDPGDRTHPAETVDDRLEHALGLAFRYLHRRDRTVSEVARHLATHDVESSVASRALETLCEQGYLDDARFAWLLVADKRELEQWGNERLRQTLRHRGIDRELIDGALAEEPGESELERALALLRGRFQSPPRGRRERERALGVMIRRGFNSELALDALAAYGREGGEPGLRRSVPGTTMAGANEWPARAMKNTSKL